MRWKVLICNNYNRLLHSWQDSRQDRTGPMYDYLWLLAHLENKISGHHALRTAWENKLVFILTIIWLSTRFSFTKPARFTSLPHILMNTWCILNPGHIQKVLSLWMRPTWPIKKAKHLKGLSAHNFCYEAI